MDLTLVCPECRTSNREEANFCRRCGRLLTDRCPRCRVSVLPDSDFCDNCGLPLTPRAAGDWAARTGYLEGKGEGNAGSFWPDAASSVLGAPSPGTASPAVPGEPDTTPNALELDRLVPHELREKLDAARASRAMVGERRIVTMLFCDVKGSTAAAEQLDPEEWTEIINGAFEHMIKPIYKYEGTVARLMGDGILAFFGAPIAHEDDPQRAVLAGLDIVTHISDYGERINRTWGIDIKVRVGINTGLVVVGAVGSNLHMEYSALGDAINLAARMEQTAEPGTVQIAYDTYKLVKPLFEFEALGGIAVKGKTDPVPAYKVLRSRSSAVRQRGIEGLNAALVGREQELAAIQNTSADLQRGVGHIVSVIGDAGLGKSRLIDEAKRSMTSDQSPDWIETASLSYETKRPYAPLQRLIGRLANLNPDDPADMLRGKLAELHRQFEEPIGQRIQRVIEALFDLEASSGAGLEGEAFRRELYEMMPLLWRQRFAQQPTVLVFDDMHWSDAASVELLLRLLPLTAEIPLVCMFAFRPEKGEPVWQIKMTAGEAYRQQYTEVFLRPLSGEQVNDLIDRLLPNTDMPQSLRSRISERAAGNPFFVEEVVRGLIDNQVLVPEEIGANGQETIYQHVIGDDGQIAIPDNLQSLLAARIDRLEEDTRRTVQIAAVIGRSFNRRILEAVETPSDGTAQSIDRQLNHLLRLEMIREAARQPERTYQFSNPLTQEVAYQTILLKRRRELHQRVGRALEELFPDRAGELAPQLAHHFAAGGIQEKAFNYYMLAGNSAARLFAHIEALDHYTRALELVGGVNPDYEMLEAVYLGRGRVLELLSRYHDSMDNYETMRQVARERSDRRLELAATMAQATIRSIPSEVFDVEISLRLSENALQLARELGDSSAEAKIHWNLMLHHQWARYDFGQAVNHGEAAVEIARESGLEVEMGPILSDLAVAYYGRGRLNESLLALEESRAILRADNNLPLLALNLTSSSTFQFMIGDSRLAQNLMDEAEEINLAIENNWGLAGSLYYRSLMHLSNGSWGEALSDLNRSIAYCERARAEMLLGASLLGKANYCGLVGAFKDGLDICRHAQELFEKHMPHYQGYPWGVMSLLHLNSGDITAAREALQTSLATLDLELPPTPTFSSIEVRTAEIKLHLAEGHAQLAGERADGLLDYLQRFHVKQFRSEALLLKAQALLALDQPQKAVEVLDQAYLIAEALSTQPALWQILAARADALERLNKRELAAFERNRAGEVLAVLASSINVDADRKTFLSLSGVHALIDPEARA